MNNFPARPERYVTTPWTDPAGVEWIYNQTKTRWARYQAPVVSVAPPTVSAVPPPAPEEGALWLDTTDGTLSVWDAAASAWVMNRGETQPDEATTKLVALAGDSHVAPYTTMGTIYGWAALHTAFDIYSTQNIKIVRPPARDRFTHGIGGCTVTLFLDGYVTGGALGTSYQATELRTQLAAGEIDTVVLSLGANDNIVMPGLGQTYQGQIERLRREFVVPFTEAGGVIVLMLIPPGRDRPEYGGEYANHVANAALWNAHMQTVFSGMTNVMLYDSCVTFGVDGTTYAKDNVGDGSHLSPTFQLHQGKEIVQMLSQRARRTVTPDDFEWITANPYMEASFPSYHQLQAWPIPGNAWPSVEYIDVTDGEPNERVAKIAWSRTVGQIGRTISANNYVRLDFTITPLAVANGLSVHVQIFNPSATSVFSLSIIKSGVYRVLTINLATATTCADVINLVNGHAEASQLVTASFYQTGTGALTDTPGYGVGNWGELRCQEFARPDTLPVAEGDLVRAYCEIMSPEGEEDLFQFTHLRQGIYAYRTIPELAAVGFVSWCNDQTWLQATTLPKLNPGEKMIMASPWYSLPADRNHLAADLLVMGTGKFIIGRHGIQRKLI